ncbi:MAG TPA: FkbM family methyltransferase, partial [Candidatus Angelobacter sp.]|nr:FkbM family methyltransferase [Candidatus Angelobacter sp.]
GIPRNERFQNDIIAERNFDIFCMLVLTGLNLVNIIRRFIICLSRCDIMRRIARDLRLHTIANRYLKRFPAVKCLAHGTQYRATRLESIPLAAEMFEKGALYPEELLPTNFTTFADLGCNVGYFTCWLVDIAEKRRLKGLMIDANPDAVKEAKWHAGINELNEVFALHGVVGEGKEGGNAEFYLYESNICSTSHLPEELKRKLEGKWKRISVPCLEIEKQWKRRFGEIRCNVLKIDVEGSELRFLQSEQRFLKLCDSVFVEWHKWEVKFDDLKAILEANGLNLVRKIDESDSMGTAFFRRNDNS